MRFSTSKMIASALVGAGLAALAACGPNNAASDIPANATMRLSPDFTGAYALTATDGRAVTNATFRGKPVLVYFGYTSCPDVCPQSVGVMAGALAKLTPAERAQIALLFITVDPARDTPETLKAFLSFAPEILGLTGSPDAIKAAETAFKVYAERSPEPNSAIGYTVVHSDLFYLVNSEGRPVAAVKTTLAPEELAAILRAALKEKFT